jgi:glycosyltransferase involved in cell wall biosynthesis
MRRASLAWERLAARWVDVILCVSLAEQARGQAAGIEAEYRVVPNAVDLDRFPRARPSERATARAELGLGDEPLAVCVGRLVPQKGQDLLVSAWADVRRALPQATLALVGDGELGSSLRGPGVLLVGHSDDVRTWLVAADLVVQPSRWEGMSLLVLEAIASGRSVVVTDVEGMREVVGDGSDAAGAIVPVGDQVALVAAIVERLEDPARRGREERRAGARRSGFGLPAWGEAMSAITREIAHQRAARP